MRKYIQGPCFFQPFKRILAAVVFLSLLSLAFFAHEKFLSFLPIIGFEFWGVRSLCRGDPLGGPEVQDQTFGDLGSGRLAEGEW